MELIVTADDFGYSPNRDDTIIHCFKEGIVTGTSLLVNGSSAESAVKKGKDAGICIGLHLNLSEGIPISDPTTIPSLVCKENGRFVFRGKEGFIQAEKDCIIDLEDVEREFRSQIQRFIQLTGFLPPYFDGHQHVHVYPRLAETIAKVAEEFHIMKTRFPSEDMDEVGWMNDNPRKPFRQVLYHNTLQSIPIFNQHHIYGGYGIGSSIGGSTMTVQRVINSCLRYPRCLGTITTIEFMVHPAIPQENSSQWGCGIGCDAFSQSEDRVNEMKVVTDPHIREYLQDKGISLCSYETAHFETTFTSHEEKKKRIIMMLSMKEGTGNTITGTRIASLLLSLGYAVQMVDTTDCYEQQNIQATIHNCNYNRHSLFYCLFSIHAIRSGVYAYHAGVPYVVMLGGTDINVNVNDSKKAQMIYSVLMNAKHIIAFTQDMKDRTESFLTNSQHPPITVIPQSTELPSSSNNEIRTTLSLSSSSFICLLPSGIRPIKDIEFLLSSFSAYHHTHPSCFLCIIGPILDSQYAQQVFSHLPSSHLLNLPSSFIPSSQKGELYEGIFYMSPIPHSRFISCLVDIDCIINTSISEGLPAIVLEAWSAGKVVIARNNSGCKSLIHSGINGLLFETSAECIQAIDKIVQDKNYREELEKSSKEYYLNGGYVEKEKNLLQQVIQSIFYVCF